MAILKCDMCGKQDATVKDMGYKLCPTCDTAMAEAYDAKQEMESRECKKCGQPMMLLDSGNFAELNQHWFECQCGHTEEF